MMDKDVQKDKPESDAATDKWLQGEEVQGEEVKAESSDASAKSSVSQISGGETPWEKEVISRVAFAGIAEQRRARRWGIFFKMLTFAYLGFALFMFFPSDEASITSGGARHTALIEVNGVIASDSEASADAVISGLRAAFKDKSTAGVILRINSPGGSPVQAGYINDEIKRLKGLHPDVPVYAVIMDICASGGYYVAVAADQIYADKASLVGSIGVLMDGFGFVDTMKMLGIERRLLTAGEQKGFLDPFSALKEKDVQHMRTLLSSTHNQFINVVKEGRGDRLSEDASLFTGLIWSGEQSLELGLVDALGSSSYVAREVIGEEKIVNFTHKPNPFENFADRLGISMAGVFVDVLGLEGPTLR